MRHLKSTRILLAISVLPVYYTLKLFSSGFLSNDDASIAISRFEHGNSMFGASYDLALSTGRFYQTIFYTLSQIPYLTPQSLLQVSIGVWRSAFILLFFVATYQFSKYFLGQVTGYLTIFITAITIDFSGWYNSLVSYPFWISLGISLTLLSAISLDKYLLTHNRKEFLVFLLFSLIGILSYEALIGSIFLYIYVFNRYLKASESSFMSTLKQNKKLFALYALMLTSYCLVYVCFRKFADGRYAGTELGELSPKVFLSTLFQESLLHSSLKRLFIDETGLFKFKVNFLALESTLFNPLGAIITLGLVLSIFALTTLTRNISGQVVIPERATNLDFKWFALLFFVPNSLLALSKLHQFSFDNSPYTMSLFSIVFLNLLIAIFLQKLLSTSTVQISKRINRKTLAFTLILILSTTATAQIRANISYVNDRSEVSQVWKLLHSDDLRFQLEKEYETIYSRSIPRVTRTEGYPFWSFQLGKKDPNFLTNGTKPPDYNNLEALKSDCGYILVLIQKGNLVKTFQPPRCKVTTVTLTTSDFQFPSDFGQILKKEWIDVKVVG
jgi:hypothetical protein